MAFTLIIKIQTLLLVKLELKMLNVQTQNRQIAFLCDSTQRIINKDSLLIVKANSRFSYYNLACFESIQFKNINFPYKGSIKLRTTSLNLINKTESIAYSYYHFSHIGLYDSIGRLLIPIHQLLITEDPRFIDLAKNRGLIT